jgi:hypothetical protein
VCFECWKARAKTAQDAELIDKLCGIHYASRIGCQVPDPLGVGTVAPSAEPPENLRDAEVPTDGTPVAPSGTLRLLDVDRMLAEPPPPVPWAVEPILALGCVTMLAGREGRGKSMLALAIAADVGRSSEHIAGMPILDSAKVLYVDAENGEREAHRRVHGLDVKPGRLIYVEADGFNLKSCVDELDALIATHQPGLVILDSLRSLAPGLDENDSMQAEAVLRPIVRMTQSRSIATLILHHASRASGEYRGSTAIGAAVELGFTLSRHEDDPEAPTRRKLACWKSRPAAEPPPRWLTIRPVEDAGILLREADAFEPHGGAREEAEAALLAALNGKPTTWPDWSRHAGLDSKHGTVRRARDRLVERGRVKQDEAGNWLVVA